MARMICTARSWRNTFFTWPAPRRRNLQTEAEMIKAIRETGRTPVQRDTFYQPIKVWDSPPRQDANRRTGVSQVLESNLASA